MFNRELRVDVVKRKKSTPQVEITKPEPTLEDKVELIGSVVEGWIKKGAIVMGIFIVLDTFRQVAIESAKSD